jgi:D-aminoacyl-tRNA deacylase
VILVVASRVDVASMNIRRQLLTYYDFGETTGKFHGGTVYQSQVDGREVKLVTLREESIYCDTVLDRYSPELAIYISRHSSKSGIPTLSVHTPGNLGPAEKGGLPRKVSIAPAYAMKEALLELVRQRNRLGLDYKVSYECTHHGPSLDVATMFVELGSSPTQWSDSKAAEAVAHAAMASIARRRTESSTVAIGVGGPHYSEKFTHMTLEGNYAFGHIIPKYAVSQVDSYVLKQCIERTAEKVETIVLDWKGIKGGDRAGLAKAIDKVGMNTKKV